MIEKVAIMIVTTCVIPIMVILTFIWILKMVTGFIPMITPDESFYEPVKSLSKRKRAKEQEN